MLTFGFIWVFCGIICAILASHRGRSVALWFFLGITFGIFAIILLLVMSEEPKHYEKIVYVKRDYKPSERNFPRWPEEA